MDATLVGVLVTAAATLITAIIGFVAKRSSNKQKAEADRRTAELQIRRDDVARFEALMDAQRLDLDRERAESARLRTDNDRLNALATEHRLRNVDLQVQKHELEAANQDLTAHLMALRMHTEVIERDLLGRAQEEGRRAIEPPSTPLESD